MGSARAGARRRLDVVELRPSRGDAAAVRALRSRAASSPLVDLASGHDAYLADVRARSKDVLAQVARRRRKLGREVGDVVVEWQTHDAAALDTLFAWKSAQYRETGVWDRFDQPWIVDVVRALAATSSDGLTGLLSTLARRRARRRRALRAPWTGSARLVVPRVRRGLRELLPGLILLLDLVAEAAERGLTLVDLGRGEHHYKLRVANGAYDVAEGVVPAAR